MTNKIKKNLLNPFQSKIPPSIILYKNINNNKTSSSEIQKLSLNEKKFKSINFIKGKKRINSLGKITQYDYNKYLKKNYSFLFYPKNQELINYYDSQNMNMINNISMYNNRKKKKLKIINCSCSKGGHNIGRIDNGYTTKTAPRTQLKINKSNSLPLFPKKEKNFINKINNILNNNNNDNEKNNFKKTINNNPKIFNKGQINNSDLLINLKKYIEDRKKERNYIHILINNSNSNEKNFNQQNNINTKQRIYSCLNQNLSKNKKINNDTLELISNEHKNIKSLLDKKFINDEEKFVKKILNKRLEKEKISNNNQDMYKYSNKTRNINNFIVKNQIELIKNKINKKNYKNCKDIELSNSFRSQLFLSISNPYEQLINTRLYVKLIDDEAFLKELHEKEKFQIK